MKKFFTFIVLRPAVLPPWSLAECECTCDLWRLPKAVHSLSAWAWHCQPPRLHWAANCCTELSLVYTQLVSGPLVSILCPWLAGVRCRLPAPGSLGFLGSRSDSGSAMEMGGLGVRSLAT